MDALLLIDPTELLHLQVAGCRLEGGERGMVVWTWPANLTRPILDQTQQLHNQLNYLNFICFITTYFLICTCMSKIKKLIQSPK